MEIINIFITQKKTRDTKLCKKVTAEFDVLFEKQIFMKAMLSWNTDQAKY